MNLELYFSALCKNSGASNISIIRDDATPQVIGRRYRCRSFSQPRMVGPPRRPLRKKSKEDLCAGLQGKKNEEMSTSQKRNEVFSSKVVTRRPITMSVKSKMFPYPFNHYDNLHGITLKGESKKNDRRLSKEVFVLNTEEPTKSSRWNAHSTPIRQTSY